MSPNTPSSEEQGLYQFVHVDQTLKRKSNRQYNVKLRQQPKHSRMCGFGDKVDRRPVDPPPIIQLEIVDSNEEEEASQLYNHHYFMYASLISPDSEDELHLLRDGKTRSTTGSIVSSLYRLKDLDNEDGAFFVFPDLSIRMEGAYRLKFSLFEIVDTDIYYCTSICSSVFRKLCWSKTNRLDVYPAKKFPGMEESTFLSRTFAEQGLKIRIRKEVRMRKSGKRNNSDGESSPERPKRARGGRGKRDDDDDDGSENSDVVHRNSISSQGSNSYGSPYNTAEGAMTRPSNGRRTSFDSNIENGNAPQPEPRSAPGGYPSYVETYKDGSAQRPLSAGALPATIKEDWSKRPVPPTLKQPPFPIARTGSNDSAPPPNSQPPYHNYYRSTTSPVTSSAPHHPSPHYTTAASIPGSAPPPPRNYAQMVPMEHASSGGPPHRSDRDYHLPRITDIIKTAPRGPSHSSPNAPGNWNGNEHGEYHRQRLNSLPSNGGGGGQSYHHDPAYAQSYSRGNPHQIPRQSMAPQQPFVPPTGSNFNDAPSNPSKPYGWGQPSAPASHPPSAPQQYTYNRVVPPNVKTEEQPAAAAAADEEKTSVDPSRNNLRPW